MSVTVVTGGARGIGAAIADAFRQKGGSVAILDLDGDADYRCDVSDGEQVNDTFQAIERDVGPIEVLVNNAGVNPIGPSESFSEQDWRMTMDVMATGTFLCSQAAARTMLERRHGTIINVASINATEAWPERLAYCAAKAAIKMMTEVLAIEWADRGVRVNTISPGMVRTELVERIVASGLVDERLYVDRTPLRRMADPTEVAAAALYLASPEAAFMTGSNLVIDGGWSAYGYA
jgi:NAD(P)-dependent dehydrogenase (short-subunit alcohol dehydrogenase family)